jgi:hypothetical protein
MDLPGLCAPLLGLALSGPPALAAPPAVEAAVMSAPGAGLVSPLSIAAGSITAPREPKPRKPKKGRPAGTEAPPSNEGLGPERARILLRSLTFPGWGQMTLGRSGSARVFALAEAGVWGAFVAFRVQQALRTESYLRTARLSAGIDLRGTDDEMRRIVGAYASSEEYNLLVVTRDAANIYLSDPDNPDLAGYREYIARHSISGAGAWSWTDEAAFLRYGGQRKNAHRAGLRANTALGLAVANRLVSALHAARLASRTPAAGEPRGWRLELEPGLAEPGRFRAALTTSF